MINCSRCNHPKTEHGPLGCYVTVGHSGYTCECHDFIEVPVEDVPSRKVGYHLADIKRGKLGELSKVREELEELIDAESQGAAIMELCEASDLVGALMAWLKTRHPTYTIHDLVKMAELTIRAFESGRRAAFR